MSVVELQEIKEVLNAILNECLPMFKIHKNVECLIRKKMLEIISKNKEIGKLKDTETIVFTLMIYAIKDLKLPLNKNQINNTIQQYVEQKKVLKHLSHLRI